MGKSLLVLACVSCTTANLQSEQAKPDLADSTDLAGADAAQPPDLTQATDLAGTARVDLAQLDLAKAIQDMAHASAVDMVTCGGNGEPCCQAAFPYCNDGTLVCHLTTCTNCGTMGQPCCGGDATTHVGGSCYIGTCLDATHALAGHCE